MAGSARKPTSSAVTVMPSCAPESMNDSREVTLSARLGGGVTGGGLLAQHAPVGGDEGEFLGDEVAGRDGEEQEGQQAEGGAHRGASRR